MRSFTKTLPALLAVLFLAGCLKDKVTRSYTLYSPVYKAKAEVLDEIGSQAPQSLVNPGKIYAYGRLLFVNELNKGVHIINNADPAHPVNQAFINIPGNVDIAVRSGILYADIFTDLLSIDISDPMAAKVTDVQVDVFPERNYGPGVAEINKNAYIVDWIEKDTTVVYEAVNSCRNCGIMFEQALANSAGSSAKATLGIAGSMARLSLVSNYMYAVNSFGLKVFSLSDREKPLAVNGLQIASGIETIYPFADKLFIGSTTGMFIYDISDPAMPTYVSASTHFRSCDPVITDGNFAYVTLRAGSICGAATTSELQVLDVSDISQPTLVNRLQMDNPYGLGKDKNLLWICDGTAGLKIYDATKSPEIKLKKLISGIEPYDVIPLGSIMLVSAKEGIFQFDYSDPDNIVELSRLNKN